METIVEKFILQLEAQLAERRIAITLEPEARAWLAEKGYDPVYGARPLARVIQTEVRDPLTDEILFGRLEHGGTVTIKLVDGRSRLLLRREGMITRARVYQSTNSPTHQLSYVQQGRRHPGQGCRSPLVGSRRGRRVRRPIARRSRPMSKSSSASSRKRTSTAQEYIAKYRQAASEFEESRLRLRREISKDIERGRREILADLLEVVDNLDRAIDAAGKAASPEALLQGVEMVRRQFLSKLEGLGVKRIETSWCVASIPRSTKPSAPCRPRGRTMTGAWSESCDMAIRSARTSCDPPRSQSQRLQLPLFKIQERRRHRRVARQQAALQACEPGGICGEKRNRAWNPGPPKGRELCHNQVCLSSNTNAGTAASRSRRLSRRTELPRARPARARISKSCSRGSGW